jgi:hypothetical protein
MSCARTAFKGAWRRFRCQKAIRRRPLRKLPHPRVERMVGLGGQSSYEYAYRIVGRMRRLREGLGETAQHAAYLDDLRSCHKAKRNFMKLLTAGDA